MKNKTPIEKSHSVWSNSKLTILCLLLIIMNFIFWLGLIYYITKEDKIYLFMTIGSLAFFLIGLVLTSKFKR